jgi:hypothetical protein
MLQSELEPESACKGMFALVADLQAHQAELEETQPEVFAQLQEFSCRLATLLGNTTPVPRSSTGRDGSSTATLGVGLGAQHYLQLLCAVRINAFALRPLRAPPGSAAGTTSTPPAVAGQAQPQATAGPGSPGESQQSLTNEHALARSICSTVQCAAPAVQTSGVQSCYQMAGSHQHMCL